MGVTSFWLLVSEDDSAGLLCCLLSFGFELTLSSVEKDSITPVVLPVQLIALKTLCIWLMAFWREMKDEKTYFRVGVCTSMAFGIKNAVFVLVIFSIFVTGITTYANKQHAQVTGH